MAFSVRRVTQVVCCVSNPRSTSASHPAPMDHRPAALCTPLTDALCVSLCPCMSAHTQPMPPAALSTACLQIRHQFTLTASWAPSSAQSPSSQQPAGAASCWGRAHAGACMQLTFLQLCLPRRRPARPTPAQAAAAATPSCCAPSTTSAWQ